MSRWKRPRGGQATARRPRAPSGWAAVRDRRRLRTGLGPWVPRRRRRMPRFPSRPRTPPRGFENRRTFRCRPRPVSSHWAPARSTAAAALAARRLGLQRLGLSAQPGSRALARAAAAIASASAASASASSARASASTAWSVRPWTVRRRDQRRSPARACFRTQRPPCPVSALLNENGIVLFWYCRDDTAFILSGADEAFPAEMLFTQLCRTLSAAGPSSLCLSRSAAARPETLRTEAP